MSMADSHLAEEHPPNTASPLTPLPSMPLQLSGFLSGDTIEVKGDTENLQFSMQFNLHRKHEPEDHFANPPENNFFCGNSSISSHATPNTILELENRNATTGPSIVFDEKHEVGETRECYTTTKRQAIVTRIRSGVLSPVTYFPRRSGISPGNSRSRIKAKLWNRCGGKREDVLERVLRRHSFPIRPCSSYIFFLMTSWGMVESSPSFSEASKKLSQMWCKLPPKEKKAFEDIALKDRERYRRQCLLLKEQRP